MEIEVRVNNNAIEFRLGSQLLDRIDIERSEALSGQILKFGKDNKVVVNKQELCKRISINIPDQQFQDLSVSRIIPFIIENYAQNHPQHPSFFDQVNPTDLAHALRVAAKAGHLEAVKNLLPPGRTISAVDLDYAVKNAAKEGHHRVVEHLLSEGRTISANALENATSFAVSGGHLEVIQCLLSEGRTISTFALGLLVRAAVDLGNLEVIQCLLSEGRTISTFDLGAVVIRASAAGQNEIVEFLLGVGAIRSQAAAEASRIASGAHRPEILDLLQYVRIASAQEEKFIDPRAIHVSFSELKENPQKYLDLFNGLNEFPPYFVDRDSPAVDLGGLTRQFLTLLMESLVEQKLIALSEMGLPMIREDSVEKDREIMIKLGHLYSLLAERNSKRSNPFTTGVVFHPAFFEVVRAVADESSREELLKAVAISLRKVDPNFNVLTDVILDPNEKNRAAYSDITDIPVEEALDYAQKYVSKNIDITMDAAKCFYGSANEWFANIIKRIAPEKLSAYIQGEGASVEVLIRALLVNPTNKNPLFHEKVEWLKERIRQNQDDHTWRKKFLRAVAGCSSLPVGEKIKIIEGKEFFIHTCFFVLKIPALSDISKEDYMAMLDSVLSEKFTAL